MSVVLALARADFLERVRRSSFLVMAGCVLWLGWAAYTGNVRVRLEDWVGTWNSAWAGGMMAMVAAAYLSMIGFWFVRNAIARDERTEVGTILAATPMTRTTYVLGKALSHFAVLASMACLLFAAAIAIQLARGGMGPVVPWHYVAPLLFVVFPALALTSACAILFETTPGLRGALGSVVWMFLFAGALAASIETRGDVTDVLGLRTLQSSMAQAIRAQDPTAQPVDGASISLGPAGKGGTRTFTWHGMRWTPAFLLSRALWLLVAFLIALAAAIPFHRFDPARGRLRAARTDRARRGLRLPALPRLPALRGLVGAELRLALAGASFWWWLAALGLWIAAWLAPLPVARSVFLVALWAWGIPRWSPLGARESMSGAEGFILTAPDAAWRQPLAAYASGVLVTALLGLPLAVRLASAGDSLGLAAWTGGALFIPALALACGAWSNTTRLFEALYVAMWYLGPLNRVPALDYMGASGNATSPGLWLTLAAAGLLLAVLARVRRLAFAD